MRAPVGVPVTVLLGLMVPDGTCSTTNFLKRIESKPSPLQNRMPFYTMPNLKSQALPLCMTLYFYPKRLQWQYEDRRGDTGLQ